MQRPKGLNCCSGDTEVGGTEDRDPSSRLKQDSASAEIATSRSEAPACCMGMGSSKQGVHIYFAVCVGACGRKIQCVSCAV